jgi:hypothetical protein
MPAHDRQFLTGLLLNRQPGILREYVSAMRSGIYKPATGCVPRFEKEQYVGGIAGRIAYIKMVNPRRAKPLELSLASTLERLNRRVSH